MASNVWKTGLFNTAAVIVSVMSLAGIPQEAAVGQDDLAGYFGFDDLEIVKIGRAAGPITVADVDGDGLQDLVVVNNFASRIEIHYQKADASPTDEVEPPRRVNEFPEHWRFRRQNVSVTHEVAAVVVHDFSGDGTPDLIYAGSRPQELVFMRQSDTGTFEIAQRHRVRNLAANRNGLVIADVFGDEQPELTTIVGEDVHVFPLNGDAIGTPVKLTAGARIIAVFVEDFDGDGRGDIAGVIPEDNAPVRLWLSRDSSGKSGIGAQLRFEMPAIREFEPVKLTGSDEARLAVIERASKRLAVYQLTREPIPSAGDRDAALRSFGFSDPGNRQRDLVIADVDGDGLSDLLATDTRANAVVLYRQIPGQGLSAGTTYASLSDLDYISAGNVDDDPEAEVFVLSEDEGVVGRSDYDAEEGLLFPKPLSITEGNTPVAQSLVWLEGEPHLAVISRSGRDYIVDLLGMDGSRESIELGTLSRAPDTIFDLDADQDGRSDLLLFTQSKPMMMLQATDEGFKLRESEDMGQFGLVKAATSENTAVFDIDDDGRPELLIADNNYVRAVRYEPEPAAGVSPGWQVVEQVNVADSDSKLVSLATLDDRIIAADSTNHRLVMFTRDDDLGIWQEGDTIFVRGFSFDSIHAGRFGGDEHPNVLAVGSDAFAVIHFAGQRIHLEEVAAWRTDDEQRLQHEISVGDVNSDGFTDLVLLDAGEQMCEILTFSESEQLHYAMGFQVFESRLFSGGETREYQPNQVVIADVTGDGANDLVMLTHDRVLIYPQMTEDGVSAAP